MIEDNPDQIDESLFGDPLYARNTGVVLLAPFLPTLFEKLQLSVGDAFVDQAAAGRAVQMLQFTVTDRTDAQDYELPLCKLLCGLSIDHPLGGQFEVSDAERELVSGLLDAVIQHWSGLGTTSQSGLRESFLIRDGRLQQKINGWHLAIEARAFDLLIDSLPWSYNPINFAWMEQALTVEWR